MQSKGSHIQEYIVYDLIYKKPQSRQNYAVRIYAIRSQDSGGP